MKHIKEQRAAVFCGCDPNRDKLETKHLEIIQFSISNLRTFEEQKLNGEGMNAARPILHLQWLEKKSAAECWGICSRETHIQL